MTPSTTDATPDWLLDMSIRVDKKMESRLRQNSEHNLETILKSPRSRSASSTFGRSRSLSSFQPKNVMSSPFSASSTYQQQRSVSHGDFSLGGDGEDGEDKLEDGDTSKLPGYGQYGKSAWERPGWFVQFGLCFEREIKHCLRDRQLFVSHHGASLVAAVGIGLLYFDMGAGIRDFQATIVVMQFVPYVALTWNIMTMKSCRAQFNIMRWEVSNGYYSRSSAILANILADLLLLKLVPPMIVGTVVFLMCGFRMEGLFHFLAVLIMMNFACSSMCQVCNKWFHRLDNAKLTASAFLFFNLVLFCGLVVPFELFPDYLKWTPSLCFGFWGSNIMYFHGIWGVDTTYVATGDQILSAAAIPLPDRIGDILNRLPQGGVPLTGAGLMELLEFEDQGLSRSYLALGMLMLAWTVLHVLLSTELPQKCFVWYCTSSEPKMESNIGRSFSRSRKNSAVLVDVDAFLQKVNASKMSHENLYTVDEIEQEL